MENFEVDERAKIAALLKEKGDGLTGVGWMYKADQPDGEEYLLGKRIDKHVEGESEKKEDDASVIFGERIKANIALDVAAKMREDPLFAIRRKEEESRKQLLENPVKMKELQRLIEQQRKLEDKKKAKKDKKKKKKKKHKHSKHPEEESSESSDDDEIMKKYLSILTSKHNKGEGEEKHDSNLKDKRKRENYSEEEMEEEQDTNRRQKKRDSFKESEKRDSKSQRGKDDNLNRISQGQRERDWERSSGRHMRASRDHNLEYVNDKRRSRSLSRGSYDRVAKPNKQMRNTSRDYSEKLRDSERVDDNRNRSREHGQDREESRRCESDKIRDRRGREDKNMHRDRVKDRLHRGGNIKNQADDDNDQSHDGCRKRISPKENSTSKHDSHIFKGNAERSGRHSSSRSRAKKKSRSSSSDSSSNERRESQRKKAKKTRSSSSSGSSIDNGKQKKSKGDQKKRKKKRRRSSSSSKSSSSSIHVKNGRDIQNESDDRVEQSRQYGLIILDRNSTASKRKNRSSSSSSSSSTSSTKHNSEVAAKLKKPVRVATPPRRKLTDEEKKKRLEEMMEDAKWREEQRAGNVKRYRDEDRAREAEDREGRGGAFLSTMMEQHASSSSVEDRLRRNKHNLQRTRVALDKNFTKK